jgi:hypothetical protein
MTVMCMFIDYFPNYWFITGSIMCFLPALCKANAVKKQFFII